MVLTTFLVQVLEAKEATQDKSTIETQGNKQVLPDGRGDIQLDQLHIIPDSHAGHDDGFLIILEEIQDGRLIRISDHRDVWEEVYIRSQVWNGH